MFWYSFELEVNPYIGKMFVLMSVCDNIGLNVNVIDSMFRVTPTDDTYDV